MPIRAKCDVLVGRIGDSYYFIDSVFKYNDGFSGCTGQAVDSVSAGYAKLLLSADYSEDYCLEWWEDKFGKVADLDCSFCRGHARLDGCEYCDYPSLTAWAAKVVDEDGISAFIDNNDGNDGALVAVLNDITGDTIHTNCSSCGRIFSQIALEDFDEVYNRKALVACLAFEDGAVEYDYAVEVIVG
jgi:hypothetical protein